MAESPEKSPDIGQLPEVDNLIHVDRLERSLP